MTKTTRILWATLGISALIFTSELAGEYSAVATTTDTIVGNNAAAAYWFPQTSEDCLEAAFDTLYGLHTGARMREVTVVNEALKLGVLVSTAKGSTWAKLPVLAHHYGMTITLGTHKIATIEADLAAGHHVIAAVNGATIWAAAGYGTIPGTKSDHAVVVDSINITAGTVTLTDSATRPLETVPLAVFDRAVATGGYSYGVTS